MIEIAESSLEYDGDVKGPMYAAFRIPEYWLIDLDASQVVSHSAPEAGSYRSVRRYQRADDVAPALLADCVVRVEGMLAD